MQARPEQFDRISERLEHTAIIQERMMARLDALEKWRDERDRERERDEERKDEQIEKVPDVRRADYALIISTVTALVYLVSLLSQHWR